jgi:hypothetical protein
MWKNNFNALSRHFPGGTGKATQKRYCLGQVARQDVILFVMYVRYIYRPLYTRIVIEKLCLWLLKHQEGGVTAPRILNLGTG